MAMTASRVRLSVEEACLLDLVDRLKREGVGVSLDGGRLVTTGMHEGASAFVVSAVETLEGRPALRRVLDLDADARERERASLQAMVAGGAVGAERRYAKPKVPGRPGRRPGSRKATCIRGHSLTNPENVRRDANGWVQTCLACRRVRRREREREKTASASAAAAPEGAGKLAVGSSASVPPPASTLEAR